MTENITKTTSTPTDAVNKAYAAFEAARQAYDISIRGNDLHQAEKDLDALKKAEKQYAIDMQAKVFAECKASPDPLKAAIEKHYYSVVSHKVNRKDGAPIGVVEDSRIKRIDLVAFCQSAGLSTEWAHTVERCNQLLTIKTAQDMTVKKEVVDRIKTTFFMKDISRQIDLGETPMSKTALTKMIQKVIDTILYADNGNGQNVYRVFASDIKYLLNAFTKLDGKNVNTIQTVKTATLHGIFLDMLNVIISRGDKVNGERTYGVSFREAKAK